MDNRQLRVGASIYPSLTIPKGLVAVVALGYAGHSLFLFISFLSFKKWRSSDHSEKKCDARPWGCVVPQTWLGGICSTHDEIEQMKSYLCRCRRSGNKEYDGSIQVIKLCLARMFKESFF